MPAKMAQISPLGRRSGCQDYGRRPRRQAVLSKRGNSAKIHPGLGFIWGIPATLPIQLVPAGVCAAVLSLDHLDAIRLAEIDKIVPFLPPGARVLDLGAGTGKQALELQRRGFEVAAIEIAGSNYAMNRVFPVTDYDGRTIPLADASIDVVFSSNVLEHVPDLSRMHGEIRRVLAPGGICLHALPTHTWRLWTTLGSYLEAISFSVSSLPRLLPQAAPNVAERQRLRQAWYRTARHTIGLCLPRRHGERGNVVSELWLFHPRWWRRNFRDNGFSVVGDEPMGLFYTGEVLLGLHLGLAKRERLALVLGSSCHLFRLVPLPRPST